MADSGNSSGASGLPEGYSIEGQQPAQQPQPAQGGSLPEGYTLEQSTNDQAFKSGTVTNDVGNTVIVPKDGESFADTMARAAQQGKQTTQDQINKELATAPGKAVTVLGAAPIVGAGGTAAMAIPNELVELAVKHLIGTVPGLIDAGGESVAKAKLAEMAPKALQIVKDWALPTSAVGGLMKVLSMGESKK